MATIDLTYATAAVFSMKSLRIGDRLQPVVNNQCGLQSNSLNGRLST